MIEMMQNKTDIQAQMGLLLNEKAMRKEANV
jgi:hypothetical protein